MASKIIVGYSTSGMTEPLMRLQDNEKHGDVTAGTLNPKILVLDVCQTPGLFYDY